MHVSCKNYGLHLHIATDFPQARVSLHFTPMHKGVNQAIRFVRLSVCLFVSPVKSDYTVEQFPKLTVALTWTYV